jgi:hypothetical protein
MYLIKRFKEVVSPRMFTRMMLVISALWLLGVYPAMNWLCPNRLAVSLSSYLTPNPCDFGQYYAGAVVAKHGIWDCLYPVVKWDVYNKPPIFKPIYKTFLFDENKMANRSCYYPALNLPEASDFSPKLLNYCPELKGFSWRFVYPPPLALLLQPLAYFDFSTAAHRIFPTISMIALFGLSFFSSRIHRLLRGHVSYSEGLIVIASVCFSFRGRTDITTGNITPVLSCFIAFAVYCWMRGLQSFVGIALIPLLLFKAIGLNWCPVLLLRRFQWKVILSLMLCTVVLNGAMIYFAGTEIYRVFFTEVAPRLNVPTGIGITAGIFYDFGIYPRNIYSLMSIAFCCLLYWGYWKSVGTDVVVGQRVAIAAVLAGTMSVFCLLNFSVWLPYFPNYLYFPFLGWLLWEGYQATGKWHTAIISGIIIIFVVVACEWIMKGMIFHLFGAGGVGVYHVFIFQPIFTFFGPLFFLTIAFRRLFFAPTHTLRMASDVKVA